MEKREVKFYKCGVCGNIITKICDSDVKVVCCGEQMKELVPSVEGEDASGATSSAERHVPKIKQSGQRVQVTVSDELHPMTSSHYIQWICIKTDKGVMLHYLKPETPPRAEFVLADDAKLEAVYAYCNVHGLWKA